LGKRLAGVPSAIGRHNLNDEELVIDHIDFKSNQISMFFVCFSVHMYIKKRYKH